MLEFLTLKPEAFGLDISDLSLKIIKLKKQKEFFSLASFGEMEIPVGIIEEGEIRDEEELAKIIKEILKKVKGEKLKTKYVVASLPEKKAFLQVIQMPRMSEEDLKSAIIYEAENYIPLPIEEVYLDFQIVPPVYPGRDSKGGSEALALLPPKDKEKKQEEQISNGTYNGLNRFDVLIAALPKKTVDPYLASLKKAGLQPKALEIESLSISRALIKDEDTTSPVLLIDLGAIRTIFIVFSGHSLSFTSSVPVSPQSFTEIISKSFGVDLAKAEKLKTERGLEEKIRLKADNGFEKIFERGKIFEALIPALTDLIEQIKKYLSYYQTHAKYDHFPPNGKGVEKILLSGEEANLKNLTDFLSQELKLPVELGNPCINIPLEPLGEMPELSFAKSLRYTTALGLALRGIKSNKL